MSDARAPQCRGCGAPLTRTFVDLGVSRWPTAFVAEGTPEPDPAYPLHARVCDRCFLVQAERGGVRRR